MPWVLRTTDKLNCLCQGQSWGLDIPNIIQLCRIIWGWRVRTESYDELQWSCNQPNVLANAPTSGNTYFVWCTVTHLHGDILKTFPAIANLYREKHFWTLACRAAHVDEQINAHLQMQQPCLINVARFGEKHKRSGIILVKGHSYWSRIGLHSFFFF